MASRKTKAIPIKWVQDMLALLPEAMVTSDKALKDFRDYITEIAEAESTLPASSVEFNGALKMFGLTEGARGTTWSLQKHELYDPPALLTTIQNEIDFVTEGSPENEGYAHCQLNNILVCCIAEEKRLAMSKTQSTPPTAALDLRPTTPSREPAQIFLQFETELKYPVEYKNRKRLLSGIADYTLWYNESAGISLVVVKAKRRRLTITAVGQLIAYMGVVHKTRLREGRRNAVVYGISTDGDEFRFWRIDNDSVISQSSLYEWSQGRKSEITSFIRYIVRATIASSPTTSPEKNQSAREANPAVPRDAHKKETFDYDLEDLSLEDDEYMKVEVVDLPICRLG
ncbi:MAG: hypothetical protein M1840_006716 [Geoglossum simile]|nr:MAG: hypothetical protein M1840_006716 [Geoglossum simile]